MKTEETRFEEDAIAKAVGIHRGRLHKARMRLQKKVWGYDHGRVAYTREGVMDLLKEIGVMLVAKKKGAAPDAWGRKTLEDVLALSELGKPAEGMEGCQRLVVMKQMPNPKVLMAGMLSDESMPWGFACRVLVENSENFVKGMEVTAREVDRVQYLYRMVGPLPRSFGRW